MIIENGVVRKIGPADIPENGELTFPDGARKIKADVTKLSEQAKQRVASIDFNKVKEIDSFKVGKTANKSGNLFCKTIGMVFPNVEFIEAPCLKAVSNGCFSRMKKLKRINVNQATTIGKNAFLGCGCLTEIRLEGVEDIGEWAFSGCHSLVNIVGLMPNSAPYSSALKIIQSSAFADTGIEKMIIPINTKVKKNAFSNSNLKEVYICNPENLEEFSFYGCNRLENIHIKGMGESPGAIKLPWVKDGYRYRVYGRDGFTRNIVCTSAAIDGKPDYRGVSYAQSIEIDPSHTLYVHDARESVLVSTITSCSVTVHGLEELEYALSTF